jgi:hypothetical protein
MNKGAATMTDARYVLLWRVPIAGYGWTDAHLLTDQGHYSETSERVLVPQSDAYYEYEPLDVPDLFKDFAALASPHAVPTPGYLLGEVPDWEARIQRFANRHGALGVTAVTQVLEMPHVSSLTMGERIITWSQESYRMRVALEVWDALQSDDQATLQRWFTWKTTEHGSEGTFTPEDPWSVDPPIRLISDELAARYAAMTMIMEGRADPTDHWEGFPSSPVQWALIHLREWVNRQLEAHTSPRLQRVLESPEKAPMQLAIIPKNLLGGMWLQFARVIEGELRYARCAECGAWFRVKPRGNRANTRFCKDVCRVKSNRRARDKQRKRKAAAR